MIPYLEAVNYITKYQLKLAMDGDVITLRTELPNGKLRYQFDGNSIELDMENEADFRKVCGML